VLLQWGNGGREDHGEVTEVVCSQNLNPVSRVLESVGFVFNILLIVKIKLNIEVTY
jgi:hypothetical protein